MMCDVYVKFTCSFYFYFFNLVTFYEVSVVLQAFILTTAVFLALTVYTLQSKRDFSKTGAG